MAIARAFQISTNSSLTPAGVLCTLDGVQSSLKNLIDFVEVERQKLQESEDVVNALKSEQEKLKPVVETDRKVIDAILDLQSQRTQADVWKERGFGFGTGILTSIIATYLLRMFERKKRPEAPAEDKA